MIDKKILIISNNPLSNVFNNGKSVASLLKNYEKSNIYQLYFYNSLPDYNEECHYYRITEKDILNKFLHRSKECGGEVKSIFEISQSLDNRFAFLKKSNCIRLCREVLWKLKYWKDERLKQWLSAQKFDVIFFVAGDSIFAYDICNYVLDICKTKLSVFVTDDYILPRKFKSPFFNLRRRLVKRKMSEILQRSDCFVTISDHMRECYQDIFNKDSLVLRNVSNMRMDDLDGDYKGLDSSNLRFVYAGGLHFNRWKSLSILGKVLKEYNEEYKTQHALYIYTQQQLTKEMKKQLSEDNACMYCGGVSSEELKKVYQQADILVHAESFERKCIESTRLSFSTKIPEYLSMGKCVLGIGPKEIASIKYLNNCAICIEDVSTMNAQIKTLLNNPNEIERAAKQCKEQYEIEFNQEKCIQIIEKVF